MLLIKYAICYYFCVTSRLMSMCSIFKFGSLGEHWILQLFLRMELRAFTCLLLVQNASS